MTRFQSATAAVLVIQVALTRMMGIFAFLPATYPMRSSSVPRNVASFFSTPTDLSTNTHTDETESPYLPSRRNVLLGIATAVGVTIAEVEAASAQPDQQKGKPRLGGMPNTIRSVGNVMVSKYT